MVSVVTGAAAVLAYSAPAPADGQATLARLQRQLSDNVNCASAKTREGKATIAALEDKIAVLKSRMEGKPSAPAPDVSAPAPAQARIGPTSGGVIDVYA